MLLIVDHKKTQVDYESSTLVVRRDNKPMQRVPLNLLEQVIISEGLDPAFGFLHQSRAGREALMLDLLEPFRAGVDLFVLGFIDVLSPEDFSMSDTQGLG